MTLGHLNGTIAVVFYKFGEMMLSSDKKIKKRHLLLSSSIIKKVMYSLSMLRMRSGRL